MRGKNAVVTGARRGIGRAVVEVFAENGANVWACARKPDQAFQEDMARLAERCGVWIRPVYFDLTDEAAVKEAVRQIQKEKLPVDILVNNAGAIAPSVSFGMLGMATLRDIFEANFFGQMLLTQYITRLMMRRRSGAVVNLSSVAALDGDPGQLEYVSSKAALIGATKKLARELGEYHIRVNGVAPGIIDTDMGGQIEPGLMQRTLQKTALGRMGTPREIGEVIAFLVSERAAYLTGQIIRVDGGM